MIHQTSGASGFAPVGLQEMADAFEKLRADLPTDWMLVAPDGRVFKGSARDVFRALIASVDLSELLKETV